MRTFFCRKKRKKEARHRKKLRLSSRPKKRIGDGVDIISLVEHAGPLRSRMFEKDCANNVLASFAPIGAKLLSRSTMPGVIRAGKPAPKHSLSMVEICILLKIEGFYAKRVSVSFLGKNWVGTKTSNGAGFTKAAYLAKQHPYLIIKKVYAKNVEIK